MAQTSIDKAVLKALKTWLSSQLADVDISERWPDPAYALPAKALTILRAGDRRDELLQPAVVAQANIHVGISAKVTTADATDQASAIALLVACTTSYEAHRVSFGGAAGAHTVADAVNVVSSAVPVDFATAKARADELKIDVNAHEGALASHPNPDTANAVVFAPIIDVPTLAAAANAIKGALNRHYVTRLYTWRVADCRQPLQLEIWTTYDAVRDDIMARLVPALNVDARAASTKEAGQRNGVLLDLGDGWTGTVDFDFEHPRVDDTPGSAVAGEFRATYRGFADFELEVKAQSARMARLLYKQHLSEKLPAPAEAGTSTTTLAWSPTAPGYTETHT